MPTSDTGDRLESDRPSENSHFKIFFFQTGRTESNILYQDANMNEEFETNAVTDGDLTDSQILCIDCNMEFVWTAGEQQFFRDKGLQNPPRRCRPCKQAKNERLSAANNAMKSGVKEKVEVSVVCARCEKTTTVPFYPSQGRPVLCRSCFLEQNPEVLSPGNS